MINLFEIFRDQVRTRLPLDRQFTRKIEELKVFLENTKKKTDIFDKGKPSTPERISFICNIRDSFFPFLDKHFEDIFKIVSKMSIGEYRTHQKYYQNELLRLIATQPLNKRIYEKPLGYPGDYIMMNYYHEDGYRGSTTYEMLLHRYTLHTPLARIVINRSKYITDLILKMAKSSHNDFNVCSIGCGPANEIVDLLKAHPEIAARINFNCLDFEHMALEQIKKDVENIEKSSSFRFNFNYLNMDILHLIKAGKKDIIKDQDFIYSLGLFDYLNDKISSKLIELLYNKLSPEGTLLVSNYNRNIGLRGYMEFLGEWYLILRGEKEMENLATRIGAGCRIRTETEKETGQSIYLFIRK